MNRLNCSPNLLILSPFASHPADAGHRRKVLQTARLFKDAGYRIIFVLYAFELPWYFRFNEAAYDAMKAEWDEVHVVFANSRVGQPPLDGHRHELDEWWDEPLETFIERMSMRRSFAAVMVHNVWLSNVVRLLPPNTVRILETHDIFWKRGDLYQRLNAPIDFYTPSQAGEIEGLDRFDLVVTVTDEERDLIAPHINAKVLTIPTFDPKNRGGIRADKRGYKSENKVIFGILGSAHLFNINGMRRLLEVLERLVMNTFAPVDIVVGGSVGDHLDTILPIDKLGYVEDENSFYDRVDFVIAPLFEGTGFKVKVADAVIFGMPTLAASHAAIGTYLDRHCCFESPEAFAAAMVDIALRRPPLAMYQTYAQAASDAMRAKTNWGHAKLLSYVAGQQAAFLLDLSSVSVEEDLPVIVSYFSYLQPLSRFGTVFVALPGDLIKIVEDNATPGVYAVRSEEVPTLLEEQKRCLVIRPSTAAADAGPAHIVDDRWQFRDEMELGENVSNDFIHHLPRVHPSLYWNKYVSILLKKVARSRPAVSPPIGTVVFSQTAASARSKAGLHVKSGYAFYNVSNKASFSDGIAELLLATEKSTIEVIWAGSPVDPRARFVMDFCLLNQIRYSGANDVSDDPREIKLKDSVDVFGHSFDLSLANLIGRS